MRAPTHLSFAVSTTARLTGHSNSSASQLTFVAANEGAKNWAALRVALSFDSFAGDLGARVHLEPMWFAAVLAAVYASSGESKTIINQIGIEMSAEMTALAMCPQNMVEVLADTPAVTALTSRPETGRYKSSVEGVSAAEGKASLSVFFPMTNRAWLRLALDTARFPP